jgi:hypothetical protein
VAKLIKKSLSKAEKIPKQHLFFVNLGVKNFIVLSDSKKQNFGL